MHYGCVSTILHINPTHFLMNRDVGVAVTAKEQGVLMAVFRQGRPGV